jgi:fatty-acid desaturase
MRRRVEMKKFFEGLFGIAVVIVFAALLFLVAPSLFLWAINSLAEAGGSSFYIEHNLWNYFVSTVLLVLARGGFKGV